MLIEGKILTSDKDISDLYNICRIVFSEEQNLNYDIVFNDIDDKVLYVVIYVNDYERKAVATGKVIIKSNYAIISHIAVLNEFRGNGYGDLAVRMLVNKTFDINIPVSYVYSPAYCDGFFEKLGFVKDDGQVIINEIIHQKMAIYKDKFISKCMS